jgi:hypothetical protein
VTGAALAEEFIRAFNERELDEFVATLHPEVEIHASRGLRTGLDAARDWATRAPGGVQQLIKAEEYVTGDDRVVVMIVREWWWDEAEPESEMAGADVMAWAFEIRDGRIGSWRSFEDRELARAWLFAP